MNVEPQAPLAHETSPSISSAISHQGFHTPIEDDLPTITSRPNSYLQPPTPTSAIMTVSLEGYLEPQRMSFSSRPFSYDETGHPFSPPLYGSTGVSHRRQSSLGFYPLQHWYPSSMAPRRSSSVSSHHTCMVFSCQLQNQVSACKYLARTRFSQLMKHKFIANRHLDR